VTDLVYAPFLPPEGDITMKTEQSCPSCGEEIVFTEEIVQLLVVQPHFANGELLLHPVLDDAGDFLYEPYFLQFMCWEGVEEELEEEIEDVPPIEDVGSPLACRYCRSGIREWEHCGAITLGEIHIAKRAPNGVRGEDFIEAAYPDLICLYCLLLINEGILELWDADTGGVTQEGECGDCLQARCFRLPKNTCCCTCHLDET
jgi:hypothetical protein